MFQHLVSQFWTVVILEINTSSRFMCEKTATVPDTGKHYQCIKGGVQGMTSLMDLRSWAGKNCMDASKVLQNIRYIVQEKHEF